ncbi:DUF916 and DUF3324 domain-containing protein [Lactiplantibacillus carotarum]|uniref:DUF916 and DUF3324 domain-containing protein n=1 Tax=Lactiplantibacillus carotarum TaxID=2993456 RepID=UPI00298F280E|nr:DUF916 and DUF3324 domain-containing protein [Lactiplantibacillus carotarum]
MRIGLRKWLIAALLMVMGSGYTGSAQAAKTSKSSQTSQNNIGYSVSAKIPKNQIHTANTFFDLKMTKGKSQTLKTVIYNTTNRDIQVETAIHTAYTNKNGAIEYVTPAKKYDSSLKYKMSDITKITGTKTVTVPANGSKTVVAQVKMPEQSFNGVILGGWYFKRVDEKVTGSVKGAMNLKNQYSYVIGLKYSSGTIPQPTMKLGSVKAGLIDYHRGITATLRNPSAVIIPNLTSKTTLTSKNSGKVVKKLSQKNIQMAPNTSYAYPMYFGSSKLQAGKYHLHMVIKNSEHKWTFDRDFTVSSADAKKYNKTAAENKGINIWWFIILGALGMLILILLILWLFFYIRKRRQSKD